MTSGSGTPPGCWTILVLIAAAIFSGTSFLTTRSTIADVPPAPQEAAVFQFNTDASAADQQATLDIISKRLTALGITPDVRLISNNPASISVLLPGSSTLPDTISVISQPGDFELVDLSGLDPSAYQDALLWTTHQAESGAVRPSDAQDRPDTHQPFTTVIDNIHLMLAQAMLDQNVGMWTVHTVFDQEGSGLLGQFTGAHIGEPLAIVVDGRVLSAPIIQAAVSGEAVIQGNFTEAEARQLAAKIGFGRLPVLLELVSLS